MAADDKSDLGHRLERLNRSLANRDETRASGLPVAARGEGADRGKVGSSAFLATGFILGAVFSGNYWLLIPAAVFVSTLVRGLWGRPRREVGVSRVGGVGMGATVDSSAQVAPDATIGMGATIREDAEIRAGSVVSMGATVKARAVVGEGASIGWGVDVGEDAVIGANVVLHAGVEIEAGAQVGEGAVIGPGCEVKAGAVVAAGASLMPGTVVRADGAKATTHPRSKEAPKSLQAAPEADPRATRLQEATRRLTTELATAPEAVKEFLGSSAKTSESLGAAADGLLRRERALRAECRPEVVAKLKDERDKLAARIAAESDARTKASFEGAVKALDDQLQERARVESTANRLDAELVRLTYTVEGLVTQVVRLKAGDASDGDRRAELDRSVAALSAGIDAVTQSLEGVDAPAAGGLETPYLLENVGDSGVGGADGAVGTGRTRSRD